MAEYTRFSWQARREPPGRDGRRGLSDGRPGWSARAALLVGLTITGAARAAAPILVDSFQAVTLTCDGDDPAVVVGDGNHVDLNGTCRSLLVNGRENVVTVILAPAAALTVIGDANRITFGLADTGDGPVLAINGSGNEVEAAAPPGADTRGAAVAAPATPDLSIARAPATLGALVLDRDQAREDISCTDRDVLIHGSAGHYVLRGGCRAVFVAGRDDDVTAELQPGARIAIGGAHVTLRYRLVRPGATPAVSVSGTGSVVIPQPPPPARSSR